MDMAVDRIDGLKIAGCQRCAGEVGRISGGERRKGGFGFGGVLQRRA